MYNFTDSTEFNGQKFLPSEAMNFNGKFIENQIEGYRTLYVSGREGQSVEINSLKLGISAGKWISTTTIPERILTIGYQIQAKDSRELNNKQRELFQILSGNSRIGYPNENVRISFNDDPDVYYFGMLSEFNSVPEGQLSYSSTFSVSCSDPFKYEPDSKYDPPKPLKYDTGNPYGSKSYPNTQSFKWIYSRHYSGLENYSTLDTDIKITIKGTVKGGSVRHLGSGILIKLPDISNGSLVIDTEMMNLQINGRDTLIEGDFFCLVSGDNGFLFEADIVNATVRFEWYHKFS